MATRRKDMVLHKGRWYSVAEFCNLQCAGPKEQLPLGAEHISGALWWRKGGSAEDRRRGYLKAFVATRKGRNIEMIAEDDDREKAVLTSADSNRYKQETKKLVKWLTRASNKFNRFGWLDKYSFEKPGTWKRVLVEAPEGSNRWRRPTPDVFIGMVIDELVEEGYLERHKDHQGPFYIVRGY